MLSIFRLAWRNVGRNPRRTGVVITAVAVGIAGTLISMAIFYGMMFQMVDNAIRTDLGHLQIHAQGYDDDPAIGLLLRAGGENEIRAVNGDPFTVRYAPRIRGEGLVTSPSASVGIRVIGIDPALERGVSVVANSMVDGDYFARPRTAVLGRGLARRLGVDVGDKIVLSVQDLNADMTGEALRVGGIFHSPLAELERSTLFLAREEADRLFGLGGGISEIVVVAHSRDQAGELQERLSAALPGREIRRWDELQPMLASMLSMMDQMAWGLYVTIFIAMAFGIANVLLMAIFERIREIGILLAVGLSRSRLVAMVIAESLFVTLLGLAIGFGLALGVLSLLSNGIDLSAWADGMNAYGMGTRIVPVLSPEDFKIPTAVALLTALLASAWPAIRAVRLRPAEAVRHD
ncbi:MAG TPA: ABC transporter permease [Myxococcales bacterium]|nr:ABC transporter permease [Myxococcales bacterium]